MYRYNGFGILNEIWKTFHRKTEVSRLSNSLGLFNSKIKIGSNENWIDTLQFKFSSKPIFDKEKRALMLLMHKFKLLNNDTIRMIMSYLCFTVTF